MGRCSMVRLAGREMSRADRDVVAAVADRVLGENPGQSMAGYPGHAVVPVGEDAGRERRASAVEDPDVRWSRGLRHHRSFTEAVPQSKAISPLPPPGRTVEFRADAW